MPGTLYSAIAYAATIPIIIFLILMLLPLYRLAQDRTAIYIVFSKTCFNIFEMSLVSAYAITNYFTTSALPIYIYGLYVFTMQSALFVVFLLFLVMAINRFHAVFMPFSYKHVWNRRKTHLYILFVSLFGIFIGSMGDRLIIQTVPYTVLGVSGAIYLAMIVKFAVELYKSKKRRQNALPTDANVEKNRILLSLIALLSILPLSFNILINIQQQNFYGSDSMSAIIFFNSLRIGNYALMQSVEEFFLIIFCEDLRTIIRKQYKFIFMKKTRNEMQITVVGTTIGQQHQRIDWTQLCNLQADRNNPPFLALSTRTNAENSKITTRDSGYQHLMK